MPERIEKAMLEYLKKKAPNFRIAAEMFQWLNLKKGATGERKFSTYGMGM
jgi:hypothetical protein